MAEQRILSIAGSRFGLRTVSGKTMFADPDHRTSLSGNIGAMRVPIQEKLRPITEIWLCAVKSMTSRQNRCEYIRPSWMLDFNRRRTWDDMGCIMAWHSCNWCVSPIRCLKGSAPYHTVPLQRVGVCLTYLLLSILPCCRVPPRVSNYQTVQPPIGRDTQLAQQCNEDGLAFVSDEEFAQAEALFRESLEHDIYNPSAHNNLGLVLLQKKRYYEAAWEFEYAAKLAPYSVQPRANLGLVFERTGRFDRSMKEYESVLEIDPANVQIMRHLARTYVKLDRNPERLLKILNELSFHGEDEQWDYWVRGQLVRLGREPPN